MSKNTSRECSTDGRHHTNPDDVVGGRAIELTGRYYRIFSGDEFPGDRSKWAHAEEELIVDLDRSVLLLVDVYSEQFTPEHLQQEFGPRGGEPSPQQQLRGG